MSKRVLEGYPVLDETALAASINAVETNVRYFDIASLDVTLSNDNGFDGELEVYGSHDKVTWYKLQMSATMAITGLDPDIHLSIEKIEYAWLRPRIVVNAGDGDIKVVINASSYSN